MAAGRNFFTNGAFDCWQRGTSFSVTNSATYTTDRWQTISLVNAGTLSRQTTGDTTNLPFIQYCTRVQRPNGNTGTNDYYLSQTLETANSIPLAGKTVTLSFYARKGANYSASGSTLSSLFYGGTGTDQNYWSGFTGSTSINNTSHTLTTTWQRFSVTFSVGSTYTQLALVFGFTPVGTAGAADYFEVTGVQLEVGSVATQFTRQGGTIQGELAACMRYYQQWGGTSTFGEANGQFYSSSAARLTRYLPAPMRTNSQTVTFPSGTYTNWIEEVGVAQRTPTAFNLSGTGFAHITFTATGMTSATVNQQAQYGVPAGAITISAEL
jgi:hypothetical protein